MSQTLAEKNAQNGLDIFETPLLKRKIASQDGRGRPNTSGLRMRSADSLKGGKKHHNKAGLTQKIVNSLASNVAGDFAGNFGATGDHSHAPHPREEVRTSLSAQSGRFADEFSHGPAEHVDVRMSLAERLAHLLPHLNRERLSRLYAFVVQALGTIALDEVLKIRIALASALKDYAHTPPKIASALARDVEREVSEPILRFCASLPDEDILELLKGHPDDWVVEAIAKRKKVSPLVAKAVIETDSRSGGVALIENDGATLTDAALAQIVMQAREFTEWQRPLANRAMLPVSIAKKLAEFVDSAIWEILFAKEEYDREEINDIIRICRRRINFASEKELSSESLEMRLHHLFKDGRLNADIITDALAMGDTQFVRGAMAYLSKTTMQTVDRIFALRRPKPIIALAWKARLPMRLALLLQQEMGQVPHKQVIYPKGGTDYPLTDDELQWQVEFFGF